MKKITYLMAFVALAFTACQKEPALHSVLPSEVKDLTITLKAADYANITSGYPKTTLTIDDDADAETYIPQILNAEYANLDNGSTAAVTYQKSSVYYKAAADSVYGDVFHALTPADYKLTIKYTDFSASQVLAWIPVYFTSIGKTPVNNEVLVLSYNYYQEDVTPSSGVPVTDTFMFMNGTWVKVYTVSTTQYAQIGDASFNRIDSSVPDATIGGYLKTFLKNDPNIIDTVKAGDVEYVSFTYYNYPNTYQRVLPFTYNGTDFVTTATTGTVNFVKKNGTWIFVQPLPVVNYTLTAADITLISNSTFGTSALRSNLASYGDFETSWATADLQGAFIACLTVDITTPQTNTIYKVHYKLYSGGSDVDTTLGFEWDGTKWVAQ